MNKTLLILGASGFFGKTILKHLYQRNSFYKKKFNKIIIFSRRKPNNTNILNKLKKNFKIIFLNKNILKIKQLPSVEFVIYCILLKDIKKDYLGVQNFSKIIQKLKNKPKIVFTSSGAVYGKKLNQNKKVKENLTLEKKFDFLNHKKNQYAYYKLRSEQTFRKLSKKGFIVSILRCFAFVGEDLPRDKNFVVGNFINKILLSKKMVVESKYKVTRSYMHQYDLANWILTILLKNKRKFDIYNVGSDDAITIHNLGKVLSKKYKIELESNFEKSKMYDYYIPNIKKAKKAFKLSIKHNSLDSIFKTIRDIRKKI